MPTFQISQFVYEQLPNESLYSNFEKIMGAAYSVSLFTDWQNNFVNEVWVKATDEQAKGFSTSQLFFDAKPATKEMHPISINDPINCTPQLGVAGPWYERLPHFKMGFTPSSGVELQSEYFVPFEHATEAIKAVAGLSKEIGPHLFITEIRAIAADDLWLSMAFQRKSIAIHFTWKQETEAVMQLLPKIEKHWNHLQQDRIGENCLPFLGMLYMLATKRWMHLNNWQINMTLKVNSLTHFCLNIYLANI